MNWQRPPCIALFVFALLGGCGSDLDGRWEGHVKMTDPSFLGEVDIEVVLTKGDGKGEFVGHIETARETLMLPIEAPLFAAMSESGIFEMEVREEDAESPARGPQQAALRRSLNFEGGIDPDNPKRLSG